MSKSIRLVFLATTIFGLFITQTALADSTTETNTEGNGDYSYRFKDEAMLGETLVNFNDIYRSRPGVARVLLLRPRTNLIREILKSAENL